MSKKLLIQFLTEWLITHGTNTIGIDEIGIVTLDVFYGALREGYLEDTSDGRSMILKITQAGIDYLKEN